MTTNINTNKTQNENDPTSKKKELMKLIGINLEKLRIAMEWSQEKMAEKTSVVGATLHNYISGGRMPSIEYLLNLCTHDDIKKKGYNLKIDDFLSNSFEIENIQSTENNVDLTEYLHNDFIGNYICYFYDQSKPLHNQDSKTTRELRFGVLSIYDEYNCITGEKKIKALAVFYKEKELDTVLYTKEKLDDIFNESKSVANRNQAILDFATKLKEDAGIYEGDITFTQQHAFVSIRSTAYSDSALMILYSPNKKADSDYLGGIGSIASVAHGRMHMPTAQKIIISRYELGCSFEEIADHLSLASAPVEQTEEAIELAEICKRLYSCDDQISALINENDKTAIIETRLNQLVRNYIEKNVCCVGSVSDEEDGKIYSLIKKYMD